MASVAIIIITYNSAPCVRKSIESVKKNILGNDDKIYFVLIDNNSRDSSLKIIKEFERADCTVVRNHKNTGFAQGVNQGIEIAKKKFSPDYYLLLNPDAFLENKALGMLLQTAKEHKIGLFSPLIKNAQDGNCWFCGAKTDWIGMKTRHLTEIPDSLKPYQTDIISGCCILIPKKAADLIGPFDEKFYLYYEDADYSMRARKNGMKCYVVPKSICHHQESQSSTSELKCRHLVKSGLLFFHKHIPRILLAYFWLFFMTRYAYHQLVSRKRCVIRGMENFSKERKFT